MRPPKNLTKGERIALFVQEMIRAAPLPYEKVREKVARKFSLSSKEAGTWLGSLSTRYFIQVPSRKYTPKEKVVTLPRHLNEARKMFESLKSEVPISILMAKKSIRRENVKKIREIVGRNPQITPEGLAGVTGLHKQTIRSILGEIYTEGFRR